LNFGDKFSSNQQVSNFTENRPVGVVLFHVNRRTDGQTNMTKFFFFFFANASENGTPHSISGVPVQ